MSEKEIPGYLSKVVDYLVNPSDSRTLEQLAEECGISVMTLYRARKDHREYIETEVKRRREEAYAIMRPVADKGLYRKLQKGDGTALKLFYQLVGDLVERTEEVKRPLTREQKLEQLTSLMADLKQRGIIPNGPVLHQVKPGSTIPSSKPLDPSTSTNAAPRSFKDEIKNETDCKSVSESLTGQVPLPPTSI